jgi:hypothetical protein
MSSYIAPFSWGIPKPAEIVIFHYVTHIPPTNIFGGHAGIAFEFNGEWLFMHMMLGGLTTRDERKRFNDSLNQFGAIQPNFIDNNIAIGIFKYIYDRIDKNIPYCPQFTIETKYTHEGDLQLKGECEGLTCATFVVAVLGALNIKLLNYDEWKGKDDKEFHDYTIAQLEERQKVDPKNKRTKRSLDATKACPLAPRIKVPHVLGALDSHPHPVGYDTAVKAGEKILSHWKSSPVRSQTDAVIEGQIPPN